jgi:hypothetical protein
VRDYGIVNEEAWERVKEFRIGEREHIEPSRNSFEKAKVRERTEKERGGVSSRTVYFHFFGVAVLCLNKM